MDRNDLKNCFKEILGSNNVYFQPPESTRLSYPCIIYSLSRRKTKFANDGRYKNDVSYDVQIIDRNPDSLLPKKLEDSLSYVSFSRFFTLDNLNHWSYTVYLGGIK